LIGGTSNMRHEEITRKRTEKLWVSMTYIMKLLKYRTNLRRKIDNSTMR